MSWTRLYDFQPGTRIASGQVDDELNQLIAAVNQNESSINNSNTNFQNTAQMSKITNDAGGVFLEVTNIAQNILQQIVAAGVGLHSFYAAGGVIDNPAGSRPIRGMAHITGVGFGWVYCQDNAGTVYENHLVNSTWVGWKTTQTVLWTGQVYLTDVQTITPSKTLDKCRNGWMLIWSDFDAPSTANDFDWVISTIPKFMGTNHNGQGHLLCIPRNPNDLIVKDVNVYNNQLVGTAGNSVAPKNDVVLRYVLEW